MNFSKFLAFILLIILVAGFFYLIRSNSYPEPEIEFTPQAMQTYKIASEGNEIINVQATTLPQFALDLPDAEFADIWKRGSKRKDAVETHLASIRNDSIVNVETEYDEEKKQVILTPKSQNKFKPGLYKLDVRIKTVQGEYITITQDFSWGVLAINTKKAIYQKGETVEIGMGVLDDIGDTKCIADGEVRFETAKVWLTIISPSGKKQEFSTDDGSIAGSRECGPKTVTNVPDFFTEIIADEAGQYKMYMEAENINGRRSIEDFFTVSSTPPVFDVERSSYPTRIYPKADYPIEMKIKANQDYQGPVVDIVPSDFVIAGISGSGRTVDKKDFQTIQWNVDWKKGQTYTLTYTITFPPVSPEFYLVGPLTIGEFKEGRNWQIASDAVFTLVQEKNNVTTSAQAVSATFDSTPGQGHLLIANCYRTDGSPNGGFLGLSAGGNSTTISSPGGYSLAINNSNSTTNGSVHMFYKIAGASEATSVTCTKDNSNNTNGPMGIQILEFTGGTSTITLDTAAGSRGISNQSTGCNNSPFQSTTASVTPTNNNALIISAFYATSGSRTFDSHTNSFIDTDINGGSNGFNSNPGAGSYDAGYRELGTPAAVTDTVTLSGAGTACANVIATFNTGANVTQGGYRFFEDSGSITPGAPLADANTNISLPLRRFRLRLLLDNDSPTGTTLPVNGGDWKLQYATLSGSCAASSYSDVTTSSTIAYADNTAIAVGANISASGDDPSDAGYTTRVQSFFDDPNTSGTPPRVSNRQLTIAQGQAGLWDLSLVDFTPAGTITTYCLRIVNGNGTTLNTYDFYPQLVSATASNTVNIFGGTEIRGGTTIR